MLSQLLRQHFFYPLQMLRNLIQIINNCIININFFVQPIVSDYTYHGL
jgi:hypothetical protein